MFWIVVSLLLVFQAGACIAGAAPSLNGKIDLRPFYSSGIIVRSGHATQLYDYEFQRQVQNAVVSHREGALPFLYPPFAALLFVPLSLLSYRGAFFALLVLNLALLFVTAQILRSCFPCLGQRSRLVLPAMYGCLFGVSVALMQGQISVLLLLLFSMVWLLLHQQRWFLAGLLLSVALIKFQLALPVILLFALWRKWRVVSGFLLGSMALAVVSWMIVGGSGLLRYKDSLIGVANQGATNALAAKQRYGMFPTDMPNLHGLSYGLSHGAHWGQWLNVLLCCLALAFAARQKPSLALAVPAAMLVSYHMQPHDLTLLLLPLTLLGEDVLRNRMRLMGRSATLSEGNPSRARGMILMFALSLLVLPLAAVLMTNGLNYLVSLAVIAVMVGAGRRGEGAVTV